MRAVPAIALLVVAGCVTEAGSPTDPKWVNKPRPPTALEIRLQEQVTASFELWRKANLDGDAKASYTGLTANFISDWFLRRVEDPSDAVISKWLQILPKEMRTELELWRAWHDVHRPERAEPLPRSVLSSEWLFKVYSEYFQNGLPANRHQMQTRQVAMVAVDGDGATLVTRLGDSISERWVMVLGPNDRWLIDGYIPPGPARPY